MKSRGFVYLSAFGVVILAIGLACGPVTTVTTPQVVVVTATAANTAPVSTATIITAPATDAASTTTSGLKTFTDQNKYFAIDVPGDWTYSQQVDSQNNYWYWDSLVAPDGNAKVESVVYDDGTSWSGTQNGAEALYLLNKFYSSTGREGDIRISNDSIQKDGSERLTWKSTGGQYSGVSFFEIRNSTAFLMFTTMWSNAYADQYKTVLDSVVASYRKP